MCLCLCWRIKALWAAQSIWKVPIYPYTVYTIIHIHIHIIIPCAARSEGKVYHFRIQRSSIGAYFVSDKLSFGTLGELINYYQNNSRSLGVPLGLPCAQQVGYAHAHAHTCMRPWTCITQAHARTHTHAHTHNAYSSTGKWSGKSWWFLLFSLSYQGRLKTLLWGHGKALCHHTHTLRHTHTHTDI